MTDVSEYIILQCTALLILGENQKSRIWFAVVVTINKNVYMGIANDV
jgi:hypothetical protein